MVKNLVDFLKKQHVLTLALSVDFGEFAANSNLGDLRGDFGGFGGEFGGGFGADFSGVGGKIGCGVSGGFGGFDAFGELAVPQVCSCFYAFCEAEFALVFASADDSFHAQILRARLAENLAQNAKNLPQNDSDFNRNLASNSNLTATKQYFSQNFAQNPAQNLPQPPAQPPRFSPVFASACIAKTTARVAQIQGAQIFGEIRPATPSERAAYLARFPFAAPKITGFNGGESAWDLSKNKTNENQTTTKNSPATRLYALRAIYIKFTNNTLGFGRKFIWRRGENQA